MKEGIHPEYMDSVIKCACGSELKTRSTTGNISVGVCSNCHPFFTGKQTLSGTEGRAEKFKQKYSKNTDKIPAVAS